MCILKTRGIHQVNCQDSDRGEFCNCWHASAFYNGYCYILLAKKPATLDAQGDISRVRVINIKKTLSNKRN